MKMITAKKGFTLVELMIYIAIIAGFLATTIFFAMRVVEGGQRGRVALEVQQNVRVAMERITREARSAQDLNVGDSTFDVHPGVLSFQGETGEDPVLFDVQNGILRMSKGANGPYNLTSDDVEIYDFIVEDLSVTNRVKVIRVTMTARYAGGVDNAYYNVSSTSKTSIVIRTQSD